MENETKKIRDLMTGDFFKLSKTSKQVFVMGVLRGWKYFREYDRSTQKYAVTNFNDNSDEKFLSGDKEVFVNFEF